MNSVLVDTDILSLFLRGQLQVVDRFRAYYGDNRRVHISIISYYEIVSGLRYRDAQKQLGAFLSFVEQTTVLFVTQRSADLSANIYADLRQRRELIDEADILIAGVALEHDLTLVTHNQRHYSRIAGLDLADWSVSGARTVG